MSLVKIDEWVKGKCLGMVLLVLLLCFTFACRDTEGDKAELEEFRLQADIEDQNMGIVRRAHSEVWSQANMAAVDELYAPEYVAHWTSSPDTRGPAELKKLISEAHAAIPDYEEEVRQIVAGGSLVVTRFSSGGTFTGTVMGVVIKNKKVRRQGMAIHRLAAGKIIEQWTIEDDLSLMRQLGLELKPRGVTK